jgi:ureidoacrylate peracid hydrolase
MSNMATEITLPAKPKAIQIDLERTAVIVVDMQNAFVSERGMFALSGINVSSTQTIIESCKNVITAAQERNCKIIYLRHAYNPDLSDSGGENSPNWHKELGLILIRERPDLKDAGLIDGRWGSEIIEELKPPEGSIIVRKQRFSGFAGTNLDFILKTNNIKYLVFVGIATNICVETTIRDAFSHDYFPILISDGTSQAGKDFLQDATIFNVKFAMGWVIDSKGFCDCLKK